MLETRTYRAITQEAKRTAAAAFGKPKQLNLTNMAKHQQLTEVRAEVMLEPEEAQPCWPHAQRLATSTAPTRWPDLVDVERLRLAVVGYLTASMAILWCEEMSRDAWAAWIWREKKLGWRDVSGNCGGGEVQSSVAGSVGHAHVLASEAEIRHSRRGQPSLKRKRRCSTA
jgi:hypothetical protein